MVHVHLLWGKFLIAGSGVCSSPFLRTSGSLQMNSWILIFLKTSQLLDVLIMFDFRNGTPRAPTTRQLNRYGAVFCSSCTKVRANMMVCKRPNINAYSTIYIYVYDVCVCSIHVGIYCYIYVYVCMLNRVKTY